MDSNFFASANSHHDALAQYSAGVTALQQKLSHIRASQRDTVESLSRAAAALRLMCSEKRKPATL